VKLSNGTYVYMMKYTVLKCLNASGKIASLNKPSTTTFFVFYRIEPYLLATNC